MAPCLPPDLSDDSRALSRALRSHNGRLLLPGQPPGTDGNRLFWDRNEIRAKLADKLADAFDRVWRLAEEQGLSLRSAALVAGIREVGAALTSRGIYP